MSCTMTEPDAIDDLPGKLEHEDVGRYFAEAIRCYHAEAYRASIIMVHNAVMAKLRHELSEFVKLGMAGAVKAEEDVVALEKSRGGYEGRAVSYFKDNGYFSRQQDGFINNLARTRNDLAHSSGREASQDEAEVMLRLSIDHFLGPQKPHPGVAIPLLIKHLSRPDYFPDITIDGVCSVVESEVKAIDPTGYKRLLDQLVDAAEMPGSKKDAELVGGVEAMNTAATNAENFLCGLLLLKDAEETTIWSARIVKSVFERRKSRTLNPEGHGYLLSLISVWPAFLKELEPAFLMRIDQLAAAVYQALDKLPAKEASRHPAQVVLAVSSEPTERGLATDFPMMLDCIIDRFWSDADVVDALLDAGLGTRLVDRIVSYVEQATASVDEAEVAEILRRFDTRLAEQIDGPKAIDLLSSMSHSRFCGAVAEIYNGEFFRLPKIRALGRAYVVEHIPGRLQDLGLTREPVVVSGFERAMRRRRKSG